MKYSAVKGMQDILPPEVHVWRHVEAEAARVFGAYGYQEMRFPVLESTDLFVRSIGETSDIVEKEMYTFEDKGARSVTMRPEGTAPAVRCYVQNSLYNRPAPQKFFYLGPMFRYERPQRGRLRQFHQIGAEAFGSAGPGVDADIISMLWLLLDRLGLEGLTLELNSLGCEECRPAYSDALVRHLSGRGKELCKDCKRRIDSNPLRILDCKAASCGKVKQDAPRVGDFLCGNCESHFKGLKDALEGLGVLYNENHALVRGLDYYTRTAFEITSGGLGAQNAVAAGGRYDGLVKEFGGPDTPAIGFALGMERLVTLLTDSQGAELPAPEAFIAALGDKAELKALQIAGAARARGVWTETGAAQDSMRSQMRRADKLGAARVIFLGDNELNNGRVGWKDLRDGSTGEIGLDDVVDFICNG